MPVEPLPTAITLLVMGLLLGVSVLASRMSGRLGVPFLVLFLVVGMLAGSEGIGRIAFEDYRLSFRVGTVALVLILFDGGLNTSLGAIRRVLAPATLLATLGVAGTALVLALGARALGFSWAESLLVGAIVSSTGAAAVFSALRGAGVQVRARVAHLLEVESGVNDPMAVILTLSVTQALVSGESSPWRVAVEAVVQLAVGTACGIGIGYGGRWLLGKVRLTAAGLYPVLTLALAFFSFGAPTLLWGSGFVAVYVAAVILGNGTLPYVAGLRRVHDAMAWFSQVAMFLLLGLLAFPSRLAGVAGPGLFLGLFLAFVARPLVVALFLLPFRVPRREIVFIAWVGLRGAVPIMLATFPVLSGVHAGRLVFDLVFFIVVVSALVQGTSIGWFARYLGLEVEGPPPPRAMLEINSTQRLGGEVLSFYVEPASAVAATTLGVSLYDSRQIFVYDLQQTGLSVRVGRGRLKWPDNYFRIDWTMRFQSNNVIDNGGNTLYQIGKTTQWSLTQTISRNSTDNPIFPSVGSNVSLSTEISGGPFLPGNVDYHKWLFNAEWYTPLFGSTKLVFYFGESFGYVNGFEDDSNIPPIEYFYMGGTGIGLISTTSLRGYEDRSVGPLDRLNREIGGRVVTKHSAELRLALTVNPIPIYILAFAEAGNVYEDFKRADFFDVKRSFGFGARLSIQPLGLIGFDYGYGADDVLPRDGQPDGWRFHFQFGRGF